MNVPPAGAVVVHLVGVSSTPGFSADSKDLLCRWSIRELIRLPSDSTISELTQANLTPAMSSISSISNWTISFRKSTPLRRIRNRSSFSLRIGEVNRIQSPIRVRTELTRLADPV